MVYNVGEWERKRTTIHQRENKGYNNANVCPSINHVMIYKTYHLIIFNHIYNDLWKANWLVLYRHDEYP